MLRALILTAGLLAAAPNAGAPQNVGVAKCKTCHMKEFKIWSASPHSGAFDKLCA